MSQPDPAPSTFTTERHALFDETDYLLREDPTITDRALYQSVSAAIAGGKTTPGGIATVLGRDARSLWHPLEVLQAGGFVRRSEDVLTQRRPIYTVADPIIRFGLLIVRPRQAMYEERQAPTAWAASTEAFATRVLGPHVEDLARQWTCRHFRQIVSSISAILDLPSSPSQAYHVCHVG